MVTYHRMVLIEDTTVTDKMNLSNKAEDCKVIEIHKYVIKHRCYTGVMGVPYEES